MIGGEVEVLLDDQQQLSEEVQSLALKLLPLLEHLLHVLLVLRGHHLQLLQRLPVALLRLQHHTNTRRHKPSSHCSGITHAIICASAGPT